MFDDVRARYDIQDPQALVDLAEKTGDGNAYLNRTELEDAADALKNQAPNLSLFDWSDNVVTKVANEFGIGDVDALLRTATRFDADGNRYLKRSEFEAAAKSMTGMLQELGVISDIDKTLLPPHTDRSNLPPVSGNHAAPRRTRGKPTGRCALCDCEKPAGGRSR